MATFVVSEGNISIDIYSQKVAKYLPVSKFYTDYFRKVTEKLARRQAGHRPLMATLFWDAQLLRTLRQTKGVLHFPHQHFGRFGYFLKNPFVVTCHDIIRYLDIHKKEALQKRPSIKGRLYLSLDFAGLRKASKIIAISENTKLDLISRLDFKEKI